MPLRPILEHPWDFSPREAVALQREWRDKVILEDRVGPVSLVAGTDVGYENDNQVTRAAVAVLDFPGLAPRDSALVREPTRFPYIPGLLSFREIPGLIAAIARLSNPPDLILCDGQGIAHPRRFGIASHFGVLLDVPTIGVAKTRLVGEHGQVPEEKGAWTPLRDKGEVIGAVLRTRAGVAPLFVSPGHRVSVETSVQWVMACITRYRLPETTRAAHHLASGREKGEQKS